MLNEMTSLTHTGTNRPSLTCRMVLVIVFVHCPSVSVPGFQFGLSLLTVSHPA